MLIVNADDLGRDREATDCTLSCHSHQRITSTSAMVFMADSARAAELALESGIGIGLHINLSEEFTAAGVPSTVAHAHSRIRHFLRSNKYALILYRPSLREDFRRVYEAQYSEFLRLFQREPSHFDGHQHMHLASNMLLQQLLPAGAKVRRSFSFRPGEKSLANRLYRAAVDHCLSRRHRIVDHFFSLTHHLSIERLERVIALADLANVELMTHPKWTAEFEFLMSDAYARSISRVRLGGYDTLN